MKPRWIAITSIIKVTVTIPVDNYIENVYLSFYVIILPSHTKQASVTSTTGSKFQSLKHHSTMCFTTHPRADKKIPADTRTLQHFKSNNCLKMLKLIATIVSVPTNLLLTPPLVWAYHSGWPVVHGFRMAHKYCYFFFRGRLIPSYSPQVREGQGLDFLAVSREIRRFFLGCAIIS
jgi:hypothetical protein